MTRANHAIREAASAAIARGIMLGLGAQGEDNPFVVIRNARAGRPLDSMVARYFMEWFHDPEITDIESWWFDNDQFTGRPLYLPEFSTNGGDALRIMRALANRAPVSVIFNPGDVQVLQLTIGVYAPDFPLAVCRLALAVVLNEESNHAR